MRLEQLQHQAPKVDMAAAGTGFLAFFKVIPWPEIAAFCSVAYFVARFVRWVWKWWRGR